MLRGGGKTEDGDLELARYRERREREVVEKKEEREEKKEKKTPPSPLLSSSQTHIFSHKSLLARAKAIIH